MTFTFIYRWADSHDFMQVTITDQENQLSAQADFIDNFSCNSPLSFMQCFEGEVNQEQMNKAVKYVLTSEGKI